MPSPTKVKCEITTQQDLNLSYMPYIVDGGLFIPTVDTFLLDEDILVDLLLPGQLESQEIEGRVIWITPKNALYQIYQGIGIQLIGNNAKSIHEQIKSNIDNTMEVGGYTYGMGNEGITQFK